MPGKMRPKGTLEWPSDAVFEPEASSSDILVCGPFGTQTLGAYKADRSSKKLIKLYEQGYTGTFLEPDVRDQLYIDQKKKTGFADFSEVAHHYNFASKFEFELTLPWIWEAIFWPGCLPGASQQCGDCVAHAASGAQRTTIAGDIASGLPDQKTNKIEGIPKVDPVGIRNGVTSSEFQYWWRGYNGDGWSCPAAAKVSLTRGCALRNKYGVVDLTQYSGSLAGKYGARPPSEEIAAIGAPYTLHGVVRARTFEELADACGSYRGVSSCGGEGFEAIRNEFGISRQRGGWSHGYKYSGSDGRRKIRQKFGGPLVLGNNNWGRWNSGPRDIFESAEYVPALSRMIDEVCGYHVDLVALDIVNAATGNVMIPHGCWWHKWTEVEDRDYSVYAGIKGWDRPLLPDYGGSIV